MDGVAGQGSVPIDGVCVKKLLVRPDERGRLFEILRSDDGIFEKFGQVYVTTALPGIVKAWHYHKIQSDYFCCIQGKARLVLFDARELSPTKGAINEFLLKSEEPVLVRIPPHVYHGFQCVSDDEALMMNIPTEPYNHASPDEYRIGYKSKEVPYVWPES